MSSCQLDTARTELAKGITLRFDTDTIEIERIAVHPYPDLQRLWVRVQLSTFATPPTIRLSCRDAEGNEVAETLLVEWQDQYISLTMHLRHPQAEATYTLHVEVTRDEQLLASEEYSFPLVFAEIET